MAITAVITRNHHTETVATTEEFCTAALTGTYATGGFTANPFSVAGAAGTSPLPGQTFVVADWYSPKGYVYVSTVAGNVMTTKIFSAPGTELANTTAVPDASINVTIVKKKI